MAAPAAQRWRGQRLGLPAAGAGSLASFGRRLVAFLIDILASSLVAALFVSSDLPGAAKHLPGSWSLIPLFLDYVLGPILIGQTLGMRVTGLRMIRVDGNLPVGPVRAAARAVGLILLVPAVLLDADLRGLHDRWTQTAVIQS